MPAPDLLTTTDDLIPPFEPVSQEDEAFAEYYESQVRPLFVHLEEERGHALLRQRRRMRLSWAVIALYVIGWYFLAYSIPPLRRVDFALFVTIGLALPVVLYVTAPVREYRRHHHETLFPKILAFFGDLHYQRYPAPDWRAIRDTMIVRTGEHNRGEDRIHGTYKGADLEIIELHTETGGKNKTLLFAGLLITIGFPKPFHGKTLINPEAGQKKKYASAGGWETVSLEDPEFERMFEVYSTDQVEARYLLTPDVMLDILHLVTVVDTEEPSRMSLRPELLTTSMSFSRGIRLSFIDRKMHIAIPTLRDRFEAQSARRPADDYDAALRAYGEVRDVLRIVDALENRRADG